MAPEDQSSGYRAAPAEAGGFRDSGAHGRLQPAPVRSPGIDARVRGRSPSPPEDVSGEKEVKPAALVEMLIRSGVLNRNRANRRFVQFTYDPVAEQLAAMS